MTILSLLFLEVLDDLEGQGHKCKSSNNQVIYLLQCLDCDKKIGYCQKRDHIRL